MIPLSAAAEAEPDALTSYYETLGRDRAIDRLVEAGGTACDRYDRRRGLFYDSPRPLPGACRYGSSLDEGGTLWIPFEETTAGPVVAGIFHESADIPNRL